jgi:hypothetical protein
MKKTDEYKDLSIAEAFARKFRQDIKRETFCNVSFRRKVLKKCVSHGPWGFDDAMYWFEDGSMLLQRRIVKEWQLFKS